MEQNDPTIDWALIDRYLSNDLDGEERRHAERLLRVYPQLRVLLEQVDQGLDATQGRNPVRSAEEALAAWRQGRNATAVPRPRVRRMPWIRAGISLAAVVSVITVAAVAIRSRTTSLPSAQLHQYSTTAGQRASITLADGSRATLGPATTLIVATNPEKNGMDVTVHGEALFTVTHNPAAPFVVHAGRATARVLGTAFVIRRYATDSVTRIVMMDGRVSVVNANDAGNMATVLSARMRGIISDSGRVSVTPNVLLDDYTAWTRGALVFHNASIRDVIAELGRAYDVEFKFADSTMAKEKVTWSVLTATQSLSDVLDELPLFFDVHCVRNGHVVTIVPGRRASRSPSSPRHPLTLDVHYGR